MVSSSVSPLQNQKRECKNINGKMAQLKIAKLHTNKYLKQLNYTRE